jgi:hypothetical protein
MGACGGEDVHTQTSPPNPSVIGSSSAVCAHATKRQGLT